MEVIFLLICISLIVALGFLMAYLNAVRDGQFDDEVTPAMRILFDGDVPSEKPSTSNEEKVK
jgi:cbb3-type cytochrome oxidase maturation protein